MSRISGDMLAAALTQGGLGSGLVHVEPPASWAAVKPAVWSALRAMRARGAALPRLSGYPLCAFGNEHAELPVEPRPLGDEPAPCSACSLRARCSPPACWSDELQPFGPRDRGALWRLWHARLCAVAGVARELRLDALVDAHLAAIAGSFGGQPVTLEPSVLAGPSGLERSVRLAVFHGNVPRDARRAGAMQRDLVASFVSWHRMLGRTAPGALVAALEALPTLRMPLGFEATLSETRLKCYVELDDLEPPRRAAVAASFAACFAAPLALPSFDPAKLGIVCVATGPSGVASLKLYLRADPTDPPANFELPALTAAHPLISLSGRRAYAVLDAAHPERRAPKWDVNLREPLLSGTIAPRSLSAVFDAAARSQLAALLDHHEFRTDVVAASLRSGRAGLYVDLG